MTGTRFYKDGLPKSTSRTHDWNKNQCV